MTEPSGASRSCLFPLIDVLSFTTGLPLCGEDTFDRISALGKFMTGVPCPLDAEPSRYNPAEQQQYDDWLMMVKRFSKTAILQALPKACPDWHNASQLDMPPQELTPAERVLLLRRALDSIGFELDRRVRLWPLDEALRMAMAVEQHLLEGGVSGLRILVVRPAA